jgi:hypothetical protein
MGLGGGGGGGLVLRTGVVTAALVNGVMAGADEDAAGAITFAVALASGDANANSAGSAGRLP